MATAGTVSVDFDARSARFARELEKVRKDLNKLQSTTKSIERGFKSLGDVARTALGLISAGALTQFIRSAAAAQEQLSNTASALNTTTSALATLRLVATESGGSVEALDRALQTAQRSIGDAALGTGPAVKALERLGLSARELSQLRTDQQFLVVAEALRQVGNASTQAALASDIFGNSAKEVINAIREGPEAFAEAAEFVERFGLALKPEQIELIKEANDRLGRLGLIAQGVGAQIAAGFAPYISALADDLIRSASSAEELRAKIEGFARGTFVALNIVVNAWHAFDAAVSSVALAIGKIGEALAGIFRRMRELQAQGFESLGLDRLAEDFRRAAGRFGEAEQFLGAFAEEAAARVQRAAAGIKSFEQIATEADRLVSEARKRASEAAAVGGQAAAADGDPADSPQARRLATLAANELALQDLRAHLDNIELLNQEHLQRLLEQHTAFAAERIRINSDMEQLMQETRELFGVQQITFEQIKNQSLISMAGVLFQTLAAQNTRLAKLQQGFAIATVIWDTSRSIMRAMADLPWPSNLVAAAKAAAMGAAQVAKIKSTNYSGGAVSGGAPSVGGGAAPSLATPEREEGEIGATQGRVIEINVHGNLFSSQETADWLLETIAREIDRGDRIIFSGTSRQAAEIRGS